MATCRAPVQRDSSWVCASAHSSGGNRRCVSDSGNNRGGGSGRNPSQAGLPSFARARGPGAGRHGASTSGCGGQLPRPIWGVLHESVARSTLWVMFPCCALRWLSVLGASLVLACGSAEPPPSPPDRQGEGPTNDGGVSGCGLSFAEAVEAHAPERVCQTTVYDRVTGYCTHWVACSSL